MFCGLGPCLLVSVFALICIFGRCWDIGMFGRDIANEYDVTEVSAGICKCSRENE